MLIQFFASAATPNFFPIYDCVFSCRILILSCLSLYLYKAKECGINMTHSYLCRKDGAMTVVFNGASGVAGRYSSPASPEWQRLVLE